MKFIKILIESFNEAIYAMHLYNGRNDVAVLKKFYLEKK